MANRSRLPLIILVLVLAVLAAGFFYIWPRLEGQAPEIALDKPVTHLGRSQRVYLRVSDQGRGLAWVRVTLEQQTKRGMIFNQQFDTPAPPIASLKLMINPLEHGMSQGPATLVVEAGDRSWRNWMNGNVARREFKVQVDTAPPRLGSLTQVLHLNRGGTGLALYTVNEADARHGVQVGQKVFLGYAPWPDKPNTKLCYFAYGTGLPANQKVEVWAMDPAGNAAVLPLNVRLRWKNYRQDKITLSEDLMQKVAMRFPDLIPADRTTPLARFIWVNEDLRTKDHQQIEAAANHSQQYQLWRKAFERPLGAPKAGFGDQRTYAYLGREVSKSVHLGADLAHTERSPVQAAARGIVRYAANLGIYGNCVILSHGQGLATLYGHLSQIDVQPGEEVKRGQTIGRSGATGLALGDHLHFSVLVQGVFVNPAEWWDPHWIQDNVLLRFKDAGLPLPLPPGETQSGS
ncbi:MAG: M23 family metallopeptidase [Desulfarculus sp.]|nr:MAG: M23 family metallopeptidase [Desulfarculus sp.]